MLIGVCNPMACPIHVFRPLIISTYYIAQYMLTRGLVHEVAGLDEDEKTNRKHE